MLQRLSALLAGLLLLAPLVRADDRSWVEESNGYAQVLLDVLAKYNPEAASSRGVEGHDADVIDLNPHFDERQEADLAAAAAKLTAERDKVSDARVKQDIDILITSANQQRNTSVLNRRLMQPYQDLTQAIFTGFHNLLDDRVPKKRQAAAVKRLHRYVGAEKGYEPIATLARARIQEGLDNASLTAPWVVEVEQDLKNTDRFLDGIRELFEKSGLKGWQGDLKTLSTQIHEYADWIRMAVLPRARQTHRLPPEIYADNLKNFGVDMDPHELMDRAEVSYQTTRDELDSLARQVAKAKGLPSSDYRDVIRALKKEQIADDQLLTKYRGVLGQIEDITRREHLITLPTREALIRLGTEAESAASPAPHLDTPRLIGNTGEPSAFVLPVSNPNAEPGVEMDDFKYDAITWTLTAHEARPGHELQFARMLEHGVSTARVVYALNSANVEGWALYMEAVMKQYEPPEAQICTLQMRLMRAARAMLDPMLNLGMIEPDAAKQFLMQQIVLSEPMAKQEVDRYTFRAPGQATAYFYGYSKLQALRTSAEMALGEHFDTQAFHDFIANQGVLPLDLLARTVMEDFVAAQLKASPAAGATAAH
jgi:uncharacterized protein (DUF885 family)